MQYTTQYTRIDVKNLFGFKKLNEDQQKACSWFRVILYSVAKLVDVVCPDSKEKLEAITMLHESLMKINALIALRGKVNTEIELRTFISNAIDEFGHIE